MDVPRPRTVKWLNENLIHMHMSPLFVKHMEEKERERGRQLKERRRRQRLTFTYGTDDEKMRVVFSKVDGGEWVGSDKMQAPATWERFSHYPLDQLALQPQQELNMRMDAEWLDATSPPHAERAIGVGPAMRAWLLGTALIAIVILILRSLDKCLHLKLVKSRELCHDCQESETQNNRATNRHVVSDGSVLTPTLEPYTALPADRSGTVTVDLPPSYYECLGTEPPVFTNVVQNKTVSGLATENPPPYLPGCCIKYSKKKGNLRKLTLKKNQTLLVNRRNIVGDTVIKVIMGDEKKTTEQNMKNTDVEVANEAAKIGVKSDLKISAFKSFS